MDPVESSQDGRKTLPGWGGLRGSQIADNQNDFCPRAIDAIRYPVPETIPRAPSRLRTPTPSEPEDAFEVSVVCRRPRPADDGRFDERKSQGRSVDEVPDDALVLKQLRSFRTPRVHPSSVRPSRVRPDDRWRSSQHRLPFAPRRARDRIGGRSLAREGSRVGCEAPIPADEVPAFAAALSELERPEFDRSRSEPRSVLWRVPVEPTAEGWLECLHRWGPFAAVRLDHRGRIRMQVVVGVYRMSLENPSRSGLRLVRRSTPEQSAAVELLDADGTTHLMDFDLFAHSLIDVSGFYDHHDEDDTAWPGLLALCCEGSSCGGGSPGRCRCLNEYDVLLRSSWLSDAHVSGGGGSESDTASTLGGWRRVSRFGVRQHLPEKGRSEAVQSSLDRECAVPDGMQRSRQTQPAV